MTKITIPVDSAKNGGALYTFVDDLSNLNSEVSKTRNNGTLIIDDNQASPDQKLELDESTILSILAENGDVEGYLFGIKQPSSSASLKVPIGVPSRTFILWNINPVDQNVKNFGQWYAGNASLWLNDVTNEIMYYNQPNPSDGLKLKASEAEIIRQIDTTKYSFLTIAEVKELVENTDWVEL